MSFQKRMVLSFILWVLTGPVFAQEANRYPVPGDYLNLVLSMSYMPDFCAAVSGKKECQPAHMSRGMVLHGLWPNQSNDPKHTYRFCTKVLESDLKRNWCAAETDLVANRLLSQETVRKLSEVMPGVSSCLHNHEWYAHGTCTQLSPEDYYRDSIELAQRFVDLREVNQSSALLASAKDDC